jgi:hypothetical protein
MRATSNPKVFLDDNGVLWELVEEEDYFGKNSIKEFRTYILYGETT